MDEAGWIAHHTNAQPLGSVNNPSAGRAHEAHAERGRRRGRADYDYQYSGYEMDS